MMINGIGISPGIAIGKASIFKRQTVTLTGILLRNEGDILAEIKKFDNAVSASIIEVETIISNYDPSQGDAELKILEAHIELLSDSQIKEDVTDKISKEKKNANDALIEVIQNAVTLFKSMDDEYMSARAADIRRHWLSYIKKFIIHSTKLHLKNTRPELLLFRMILPHRILLLLIVQKLLALSHRSVEKHPIQQLSPKQEVYLLL